MNGISVVIAAHNAEHTLSTAVRSALLQTRPPVEVVVVDDGSTDDTLDVAHDLAKSDDRIEVVAIDGPSGGPGRPRNVGVGRTTGDRVLFLDADDRLTYTAIASLSGSAAVVYGGVLIVKDGVGMYRLPLQPLLCPLDLTTDNAFPVHAASVDKRWFERVGGFSESRDIASLEDWHFWQKLALSGATFEMIDPEETVGIYNLAPGTLSSRVVDARIPVSLDLVELFPEHRRRLRRQLRALRRQRRAL